MIFRKKKQETFTEWVVTKNSTGEELKFSKRKLKKELNREGFKTLQSYAEEERKGTQWNQQPLERQVSTKQHWLEDEIEKKERKKKNFVEKIVKFFKKIIQIIPWIISILSKIIKP